VVAALLGVVPALPAVVAPPFRASAATLIKETLLSHFGTASQLAARMDDGLRVHAARCFTTFPE
jgi:hypothetical protein